VAGTGHECLQVHWGSPASLSRCRQHHATVGLPFHQGLRALLRLRRRRRTLASGRWV